MVENNTQTHSKQHRNTLTYILEHTQKELSSHYQDYLERSYTLDTGNAHTHLHTDIMQT